MVFYFVRNKKRSIIAGSLAESVDRMISDLVGPRSSHIVSHDGVIRLGGTDLVPLRLALCLDHLMGLQ